MNWESIDTPFDYLGMIEISWNSRINFYWENTLNKNICVKNKVSYRNKILLNLGMLCIKSPDLYSE